MTFGSVVPIVPAVIKSLMVGKLVFDVIERQPRIRSPENAEKMAAKI